MSDFDKEAEREKLREKFEKEEQQREATEQMSELLLKGATMTNAHCSECGDPIFRYDGQEFCPTCQKPITRDAGGSDESDDESGDGDHIEVANPSDEARVQFGGDDAVDGSTADTEAESPDQPATTQADSPDQSTAQATQDDAAATQPDSAAGDAPTPGEVVPDRDQASTSRPEQPSGTSQSGGAQTAADTGRTQPATDSGGVSTRTAGLPEDAAADLTEAKRLLAATTRRFAHRAAESEDPRDAREHLQAAREAATALDATNF